MIPLQFIPNFSLSICQVKLLVEKYTIRQVIVQAGSDSFGASCVEDGSLGIEIRWLVGRHHPFGQDTVEYRCLPIATSKDIITLCVC